MITINSGKIMIPRTERFVGFAGDNLHKTVQFYITPAESNCTYNLILSFSDNSVRIVPLSTESADDGLILTWNVRARHLPTPGMVWAQIKIESSNSDTEFYTGKNFFIVGDPGSADDESTPDTSFDERVLNAVRARFPYIGTDGYWYIFSFDTGEYIRSVRAEGEIDTSTLADYVLKTRSVGSNTLSSDISSAMLASDVATGNQFSYYLPETAEHGRIVYRDAGGRSYLWAYLRDSNDAYGWEAVATENSDVITAKVDKTTTIAGVDLQDNITAAELKTALSVPANTSDLTNDSGFLTDSTVGNYALLFVVSHADPPTITAADYKIPTLWVKLQGGECKNFYLLTNRSKTPDNLSWNYTSIRLPSMQDVSKCAQKTVSLTLPASSWSNLTQGLTIPSGYTVTSDTKVDIRINDTVFAALRTAGCKGLYVENSSGTLTVHAIGAAPTTDILVQFTLSEVTSL